MQRMEHIHFNQADNLGSLVGRALEYLKKGTLVIEFSGTPAVKVDTESGKMTVDLLRADVFKVPRDD